MLGRNKELLIVVEAEEDVVDMVDWREDMETTLAENAGIIVVAAVLLKVEAEVITGIIFDVVKVVDGKTILVVVGRALEVMMAGIDETIVILAVVDINGIV